MSSVGSRVAAASPREQLRLPAAAAVACLGAFAFLAAFVPRSGPFAWEDGAMYTDSAWRVDLVVGAPEETLLGLGLAMALATTAAAAVLALRRRYLEAATLVICLPAVLVLDPLVKGVVQRTPAYPAGGDDYSFPSGAAMVSMIVVVAVLLGIERDGARMAAAVPVAASVLVYGCALVLFGWHYPTDVIAGWLLSGGVAAAVWLTLAHLRWHWAGSRADGRRVLSNRVRSPHTRREGAAPPSRRSFRTSLASFSRKK
jgi:membrane-associated phospholipid phosphatase